MTVLKAEECMQFFAEVLGILKSTHQSEKVLSLIVDRIVRIYKCQTCAVVIIDPGTEYLHVIHSHNLSYQFVKEYKRAIGAGAIAKLLSVGKSICVSDAQIEREIADEIRLEHDFRSAVCTQISAEFRTLGYIYVDSVEPNAFSVHDIKVLQSFADLASIALNKAYLYEKNLRLDPIDPETGLVKYAPFLEKLGVYILRSEKEHRPLSLFILDIDNYKQIAGTYGYELSKLILKEIGEFVKSELEATDAIARYGFDEIIFLKEDCSFEDGLEFGERIRKGIENSEFTKMKIRTTVSIGVVEFPQHAKSDKELLLTVKEALYNAQHQGRNRVASV